MTDNCKETSEQVKEWLKHNAHEIEGDVGETDFGLANRDFEGKCHPEDYGYEPNYVIPNLVDNTEILVKNCLDITETEWERQRDEAKRNAEIQKRQGKLL